MASEDIAKEIGKELMKGARQAGKEMAKNQGGGNGMNFGVAGPAAYAPISPETKSTLDRIAAEATQCRVSIQRMDPMTGAWEFIPSPGTINPQVLVDPGIENLVMEYAGGGQYQVTIRTPGYPEINKQFRISGRPKEPGQGGMGFSQQGMGLGQGQGQGQFGGMPQQSFGGFGGMGFGMNPWAPAPQRKDESANILAKMLENQMAMQMLQTQKGHESGKGESDQVRLMREQWEREREEARRKEEQLREETRRREEQWQRKFDEMERTRQLQELQSKSDQRFEQLVAMIKDDRKPQPTIGEQLAPFIPLLKQDNGMAEVYKAMAESQASSSNTLVELMKAQNERPGLDEKFANIMGSMASVSTQIMQQQMAQAGGGSPWVDLLSQTIGEVSDVFKTMFTHGGGGEEQPQVMQAGQAQVMGQDEQVGWGGLPANAAEPNMIEPYQEQVAGMPERQPEPEPKQDDNYDLNADPAFKTILDRVQGGGSMREVAVRLYRHGNGPTGHPVAKAWYENPDEVGDEILTQVGVPAERRRQVADAVVEFNKYLAQGGDPETYSREVPARRPRRRVPTIEGPGGELVGQHFDPTPISPPKEPSRQAVIDAELVSKAPEPSKEPEHKQPEQEGKKDEATS